MAEKKPRRIWDNYRVISEVQKNERLKFVIAVGARDGFRCVVIREFYLRKRDMQWMPGRDGIIVPLVSTSLDENGERKFITVCEKVLKELSNAKAEAATMELFDPEHAVWQ